MQASTVEKVDLISLIESIRVNLDTVQEMAREQQAVMEEVRRVQPVCKGSPTRCFVHESFAHLSDIPCDMRHFNAVHVDVLVTGATPSATLTIEGSDESGGQYRILPDGRATKASITADTSFDLPVGTAWGKPRLASITGTFGTGLGFTVILTPFLSAGTMEPNFGSIALSDALPAGDNNIGNVDLASAIPEGDNNIGNVDLASAIPTGTNTIGATQDAGPSWTSTWGVSAVPVTSANMSASAVAATDAPTSGQKIVIDDILVSSDTALRFIFTCETTGAVIGHVRLPANGSAQITFRGKRKLATVDKKLYCQTSAAGNVEVLVGYHSEA